MAEIKYETEMSFAREFYKGVIEDLMDEDCPPDPDLFIENYHILKPEWELLKTDLVQKIEDENFDEKEKEAIKEFLKCSLGIYMDLMCSICKTFIENTDKKDLQNIEEIKD